MLSWVFQELHDVWYHNRLSAEVDVRIQLSSIKPDMKDSCKNVKECHFLSNFFVLENKAIFQKYIGMNMYQVYYCYFEINIFKKFLSLKSNMLSINR